MMFERVGRSSKKVRRASGMGVLVALGIGLVACGGGRVAQAVVGATATARMAAAAATSVVTGGNWAPDPIGPTSQPTTTPATGAATGQAGAPASSPAAGPSAGASQTSSGAAPNKVAGAAAVGGSVAAPGAAAAAVNASPGPSPVAAVISRRQPSAAEVKQAISSVHDLLPFFTPTATDVAQVGDQVCTAFDQGKSFAQVTSKALDLVGAGSYSWMIPSSVPAAAVRTVVNLYCPGYASKLG